MSGTITPQIGANLAQIAATGAQAPVWWQSGFPNMPVNSLAPGQTGTPQTNPFSVNTSANTAANANPGAMFPPSIYPYLYNMSQFGSPQQQQQATAMLAATQPPQIPQAPGQDVHGGSESR